MKEVQEQEFIQVSRTYKGEPSQSDTINIRTFVEEPARVTVTAARTVNLGNYESLKVSISVSLPCYKEEVEDTYAYARNFVEKRLDEELAEAPKASSPANYNGDDW